jgi:hypothetical protein
MAGVEEIRPRTDTQKFTDTTQSHPFPRLLIVQRLNPAYFLLDKTGCEQP